MEAVLEKQFSAMKEFVRRALPVSQRRNQVLRRDMLREERNNSIIEKKNYIKLLKGIKQVVSNREANSEQFVAILEQI